MLNPGVVIAVRGIGRREHGLRECGDAENAEEAEELCGIIPGMQAVCSMFDQCHTPGPDNNSTHVARGWSMGDKGLKTGQRELETDAEQSFDSFSARRDEFVTGPCLTVVYFVNIFDHYSSPRLHGGKKIREMEVPLSKRQGRLRAQYHGTCTRLVHGVSCPAAVAAS